ncbi:MAG: sulfotransferase [Candidatus Marinimicrobia bacterium]|nr:sulfotransferase [Candidatus Neomarinimicrobiota bacterium]
MIIDFTLSNESGFHGPLFLVGMPRSGTKLLRVLLVRNPLIKILPSETNFIPYLVNRFGKVPEFTNESYQKTFYSEFNRTSFYWAMKKKGLGLEYDSINPADLSTWSTTFKYILRYYSSDSTSEDIIWGDKSPAYVNHMIILKETFPKSNFIF